MIRNAAQTNAGTSTGNIDITAAGAVTVEATGTGGTGVTIDGLAASAGSITLAATGTGNSLSVAHSVTSKAGAITLRGGDNVSFTTAGDVTSTTGNVTVTGNYLGGVDTVGAITLDAGTTINAGSGTITMAAPEDITLTGLSTTNTTTSAVSITSTAGKLIDAGDAATDIVANGVGARTTLSAVTGIGTAGAIDTQIANLVATNSGTAGNIEINETDALVIRNAAQTNAGTSTGNIDITAAGAVTVEATGTGGTGVTTRGGVVTLNGPTISLLDNITTLGGAVSLTGTTLVSQSAGKAITTTAGANSGTASGTITINVSGTGTVDLAGSLVTTGTANNAGIGSAGGNVTIDTANGTLAVANISTSGGASTNVSSNGGAAGMIAINTGANNTITLNGGTLSAVGGAPGTGGVQGSGGSISFGDPVTLASGAVSVNTGATAGDITFAQTVNGGRDLSLTAGTGAISFNGAVGGITPLGDGTGVALGITSGTTTFNSALTTASGFNSDANVFFKDNVTLGAGDTASSINANTTFNRVGGLTLTAGRQVTFGDAGTDQVTLSVPTTITTAAANAGQVFNAKVDGANSLSVAAGSGSVAFSGAVGSVTALTSLTISGGGISLASIGAAGSGVTGNVDIKGGGAVSQSGAWSIGGNLWVNASAGNIALKSLNTLSGRVSLIASGTNAEVWLYADNIDVNTVEAPSGAGGVTGILGTTVILQADQGGDFKTVGMGGADGLVKATAASSSTAALTIKASGAIGSTAIDALKVETSGLVVVEGSGVSDGTINLKGDDKIQPKYEFSGNPLYRKVLYNGNEATNAQLTGALDAAYLDIRNQTTEIRESGFAKENASKVLRRGVVTSAGPGQPAVDDSTGMAGAEECEGGFANDSLSCQ